MKISQRNLKTLVPELVVEGDRFIIELKNGTQFEIYEPGDAFPPIPGDGLGVYARERLLSIRPDSANVVVLEFEELGHR